MVSNNNNKSLFLQELKIEDHHVRSSNVSLTYKYKRIMMERGIMR